MALHPVGPLPASTYWRRRAVLLVGVLVLLWLLRSCAGGSGDTGDRASGTPAPTATARPTATASPTASASAPPVAAVSGCADAVLALTGSTDAETYAVGTSPRLTLVVKNTGPVPCNRDLGSGAVELLVYSGQDRIWSSDDCSPAKGVAPTRLAPGGTQAVALTWAGKRSRPGCTGTATQAQAGTYRLVARVGTLRGDVAVFRFRS
jgi:hypothetical protein